MPVPKHASELDDLLLRVDYASATINYYGHAACGSLQASPVWRIDDANAGALAHINQPMLNRALEGADLKIGADGASIWSQRSSGLSAFSASR